MSRIPFRHGSALAALTAAGASLAMAGPAGATVIQGNNNPTYLGRHTIDSMVIDYQGSGSFTTCGEFLGTSSWPPPVIAHNCGTLDVGVATPNCVNRLVDVNAWTNDNNDHNFVVTYKDNGC